MAEKFKDPSEGDPKDAEALEQAITEVDAADAEMSAKGIYSDTPEETQIDQAYVQRMLNQDDN
jgi:hypothetical protein